MVKEYLLKFMLASAIAVLPFAMANAADDSHQINNAPTNWQAPAGLYIEGTGGTNLILSAIGHTSSVSQGLQGVGWSAAMGYRINPGGLAMELGFGQNTLDVKTNPFFAPDTTVTTRVRAYVPYAALRWDVLIADSHFAFIPKLGIMYVDLPSKNIVDSKDPRNIDTTQGLATLAPFIGLGMSYAVTHNIRFVVQYQGAVYGFLNAGLLSAGLDYYFGSHSL